MGLGRASRTLVAVVVGMGGVAAGATTAAADEAPKPRSITVVGLGRERGAPDMAQLQFAVEHSAATARAASEAAAASVSEVLKTLRSTVGEGGRVETQGFSLNPVYRREPERPAAGREGPDEMKIVGYTVVHQIFVETRRIDGIGEMIDTAITAGAARVSNLMFTIHDPAPVQARALKAAGADAAAQAAAVAEALGVRLTRVLEATTEGPALPFPQRHGATMVLNAEFAMAATPIAPGEVTTEARLRVRYGIE